MSSYIIYPKGNENSITMLETPEFLLSRQYNPETHECIKVPEGVDAAMCMVVNGQLVMKQPVA